MIQLIGRLQEPFFNDAVSINERKFDQASKEFLRNNEYRNRVKLNRAGIGERMERCFQAN